MAACVTAARVVDGQRVGSVLTHVVKDAVRRRLSLFVNLLVWAVVPSAGIAIWMYIASTFPESPVSTGPDSFPWLAVGLFILFCLYVLVLSALFSDKEVYTQQVLAVAPVRRAIRHRATWVRHVMLLPVLLFAPVLLPVAAVSVARQDSVLVGQFSAYAMVAVAGVALHACHRRLMLSAVFIATLAEYLYLAEPASSTPGLLCLALVLLLPSLALSYISTGRLAKEGKDRFVGAITLPGSAGKRGGYRWSWGWQVTESLLARVWHVPVNIFWEVLLIKVFAASEFAMGMYWLCVFIAAFAPFHLAAPVLWERLPLLRALPITNRALSMGMFGYCVAASTLIAAMLHMAVRVFAPSAGIPNLFFVHPFLTGVLIGALSAADSFKEHHLRRRTVRAEILVPLAMAAIVAAVFICFSLVLLKSWPVPTFLLLVASTIAGIWWGYVRFKKTLDGTHLHEIAVTTEEARHILTEGL